MYLKIHNKKYEVKEYKKFKERFSSLKFYLNPVDFVLYFPNKKFLNTNFFCQRVDACFTDKDYKILYIFSNVKSEKRILRLKSKHLFIMPIDTSKHLKIGDVLKIEEK